MDGLNRRKTMRIGIFGGTFDPPHLGHLILAMEAASQLNLDRLLWMVTPDPPHKNNQVITPITTRIKLVQAALEGDPVFELSTLELERKGPQYALDTVRELRKLYPEAEIIYLIGEDSLQDLPKWHEPKELIQELDFLGVMHRPGGETKMQSLEKVLPGLSDKVKFIDAPLLEISSRQIRDRIQKHQPYKYYLPEKVFQVINTLGLYLDREDL
jgi:nicotinate-nucleotide adenylyltransferase